MKPPAPVTIVNVGYKSTNYWVVSTGTSRLLVDLGYPGTMGRMLANLKRMDIALRDLRYGLATHYHIDHAGLAQDFKQAGVPAPRTGNQLEAIPRMKQWTRPEDQYRDITLHDKSPLFTESRRLLEGIGLREILPTPGHSDDSVSLVLDGSAFTGDLTPMALAVPDQAATLAASWQRLRDRGATRVYPGHGPVRPMPEVQADLALRPVAPDDSVDR
jgi:glyoxylase-like metal-dependent hydrolase (beta-lactamase superfamily II)